MEFKHLLVQVQHFNTYSSHKADHGPQGRTKEQGLTPEKLCVALGWEPCGGAWPGHVLPTLTTWLMPTASIACHWPELSPDAVPCQGVLAHSASGSLGPVIVRNWTEPGHGMDTMHMSLPRGREEQRVK